MTSDRRGHILFYVTTKFQKPLSKNFLFIFLSCLSVLLVFFRQKALFYMKFIKRESCGSFLLDFIDKNENSQFKCFIYDNN